MYQSAVIKIRHIKAEYNASKSVVTNCSLLTFIILTSFRQITLGTTE